MHQGQSRLHNGPIDPLEKFDRVLQVISGFDSVLTEDHIPAVCHTSHPIYLLIIASHLPNSTGVVLKKVQLYGLYRGGLACTPYTTYSPHLSVDYSLPPLVDQ